MPDQPPDTVTVTVDAEGDQRTLDLPEGFVDLVREPGESAADVVADLVLLSGAQRTYEAVHFSEGGVPDEVEAVDDRMQELFESEFGTTLRDVVGYPEPSEDH